MHREKEKAKYEIELLSFFEKNENKKLIFRNNTLLQKSGTKYYIFPRNVDK